MTAAEILEMLASDNAHARPSLTGPEWHEIVLSDDRVIPLLAADFDRLRDTGLLASKDEGTFVITSAGRSNVKGEL